MLSEGTIVDDRYEIISKLGEGGMGTVYKAKQLGLDRIVALKLLHSHLIEDAEQRERFGREGKILSRLSHQHLMFFYEFGFWNSKIPYIAMEFLSGTSFKGMILSQGPLGWQRCCKIAIQICQAMTCAHENGVVHRDLSPNNVMLLNDPEADFVKVVDFGLARAVVGSDSEIQKLTRTGTLMGSPHYMSPEQCQGRQVDTRSDIYSLACCLYEAVSGKLPFDADNAIGLIHKHLSDDAERLNLSGLKLPGELESIIFKAMARSPENRYQSMAELQSDLEHLLRNEHDQISAPVLGKSSRKKKPGTASLLMAVSAVIVLAVLAFGLFTDPGFAAPVAGILRAIKSKETDNLGKQYGKWLVKQDKLRGAEMIFTSILSGGNTNYFSHQALANLWFTLARTQFRLSETNLGCKSLLRGLQELNNVSKESLMQFGSEAESMIKLQFESLIVPPTDPNAKQSLKALAKAFDHVNQTDAAVQVWKLYHYKGRKDVELQISQCCETASKLDGESEARECLIAAEDLLTKNEEHLDKNWQIRLHCVLATEWFHIRDYKNSDLNIKRALKLIKAGHKADQGTTTALQRGLADLNYQLENYDAAFKGYKRAYLSSKKLFDNDRTSSEMMALLADRLIAKNKQAEAKSELIDFQNTTDMTTQNEKSYVHCLLALVNAELDLQQTAEAKKQIELIDNQYRAEVEDCSPRFFYYLRLRLALRMRDYSEFCKLLSSAETLLPPKHRTNITEANDELLLLAGSAERDKVPWEKIRESCKVAVDPVLNVSSLECAADLYAKGKMTDEKEDELLNDTVKRILALPSNTGIRKAEINYFQEHALLAARRLYKLKKFDETLRLLEIAEKMPTKSKTFYATVARIREKIEKKRTMQNARSDP